MEIIGHTKILDFFVKVIDSGHLNHAYCFVGPENVGKKTVAEYISAQLIGTPFAKLSINPDFILVDQLFDEKTEKTKKDISVSQIRTLREQLARRSYYGGYKVAVINGAEKMNSEACNALLKTLEEPSEKTVLFLITTDEKKLPETIQSRCQKIYFYPVEKDLIKKHLEKIGTSNADELAQFSFGLPGRACEWASNNESYEWYKKEVNRFNSLFKKNFHEKIKVVEELFGDKTDHIATRTTLFDVLNVWQWLVRDSILKDYSLHNLKIELDNKNAIDLYKKIEDAKQMLAQNIHPRLLVENILLQIP
ncbi:MAG: AAA family ATPase [Candidatus Magasanikiibacteriota bacterium]